MNPIIIIGTGLAGYSAAREFRKHETTTPLVLVTRDDGASYYKPDLSESLTHGHEPDALIKKDAGTMAAELDAEIRTYVDVEAIDPAARTVTVSGESLAYDKLVLAWGADPIRLPLGGDAVDSVYRVNNLRDYRGFRPALERADRIAILGAGLIGSEFANDLVNAGHRVTAIDPMDWPLGTLLPQACGQALRDGLAAQGVDYRLGVTADNVHAHGDGFQMELADGHHVNADLVLSAVGLRPVTALATDAGLTVDRGIIVDRTLCSSDPHIFALGDCAEVDGRWLPFVMPLMNAARALGKTLAGEDTPLRYPVMPVIVKTPACPTLVYPPRGADGEWHVAGDTPDLEARYEAADGTLEGFALTGEATGKRRDYIRAAQPVLS